jgi:hypothetical protein
MRLRRVAGSVAAHAKSRWRGTFGLIGLLFLFLVAPRVLGAPEYCKCIFDTSYERGTAKPTKLDDASKIYATAHSEDLDLVQICIGDDHVLCRWGQKNAFYTDRHVKEVKSSSYWLEQSANPGVVDRDRMDRGERIERTGVVWVLSLWKTKALCQLDVSDKNVFYSTDKMSCGNYALRPGVFDTPLW